MCILNDNMEVKEVEVIFNEDFSNQNQERKIIICELNNYVYTFRDIKEEDVASTIELLNK